MALPVVGDVSYPSLANPQPDVIFLAQPTDSQDFREEITSRIADSK
jgi:hypothetical protein